MSVEASFIVPAATFIIAFIIYMAFFMYGRCLLSQDVYIMGFRAAVFYEDRGYASAAAYVDDRSRARTEGRYFASGAPKIKAYAKGKQVQTEGSINTVTGSARWYFKALPDSFKASQKALAQKHDMALSLRKVRRVKDIAAKVSGDSKNGH